MSPEQQLADTIAKHCYDHYGNMPKKGKPQKGKEWTLLAAIVQENKGNGECGRGGRPSIK
jgi:tRNA-specific adenosine deaminase 1